MSEQGQSKNITWKETSRTLTLTGEPVLELALSWPVVENKQMKRISRYYERLSCRWKEHWEREGYWQACSDLAQQREQSRPFRVWRAALSGQVMLDRDGYLSIAMMAREVRGDGRALEYRWGDTWRWEDGGSVTLKELFCYRRKWKKQLERELFQAARECRSQGVCLDEPKAGAVRRWLREGNFVLGDEKIIFYVPQCTIAPAVEGAVALSAALPEGLRRDQEKDA